MRIVSPGYEQRRGIALTRDLHDGVDRRIEARSLGRRRGIREIEKTQAILRQAKAGYSAACLVIA